VYWGYDAVLDALLADPRVDPSAEDNALIRLAVKQTEPDCIRRLLWCPRVLEGNLPLEEMDGADHIAEMQKLTRSMMAMVTEMG
jgi:hypothetical protein